MSTKPSEASRKCQVRVECKFVVWWGNDSCKLNQSYIPELSTDEPICHRHPLEPSFTQSTDKSLSYITTTTTTTIIVIIIAKLLVGRYSRSVAGRVVV